MAITAGAHTETITAVASGSGAAGIGVIRVSGNLCVYISEQITGSAPIPRYAHYTRFKNQHNTTIDKGLVLYFPAPHSYTGEDVLELHSHGSPVVMDLLIQRILSLGARLARPGEFSERAFLNNKIDLVQAEAVADLIQASSEKAAIAAMQSLEGVFSQKIQQLNQEIIYLRSYIEAAIDFPEEEIDFLSSPDIKNRFSNIITELTTILSQAKQGALLQTGISIAITGKPNAGKSSLLNKLSLRDSAIVTSIPGTTRDILRENIHIDGMPCQIIDTAGLRETDDVIEKEGIRRTKALMEKADKILCLIDLADIHKNNISPDLYSQDLYYKNLYYKNFNPEKIIFVFNKIDQLNQKADIKNNQIYLSAKTGEGIDLLKLYLKNIMGFSDQAQTPFSARQRHLDALRRGLNFIEQGFKNLTQTHAPECAAEDLRLAHQALGEITGEFTTEDLLGHIFSNFCIGK